MSVESVMPPNHLILCRAPLPLPSILPSIRGFSNESALCVRWPKYWSFSFSVAAPSLPDGSGSVFLSFPVVTPPPSCHGSTKAGGRVDSPGPRPGEVTARPGLDGRVMVSRGQRGVPGQAGAGVGRFPGSQCGSLPPGHHLCPGRARAPGWLSTAM